MLYEIYTFIQKKLTKFFFNNANFINKHFSISCAKG